MWRRRRLEYLDKASKSGKPFFMSVNFMKVHQPNLPAPEFIHKSLSKSKYADSIVEADTRIGHILDKVRSLGIDKNTYVFWTTDNGAWQDVYPDAGYTPFRGTKGTVRRAATACPPWPGARRSRPEPGTTISLAASTSWRRLRRSPARSCLRRIAKGNPSSSTATTCRRSSSARGNRRGNLVLLHRK